MGFRICKDAKWLSTWKRLLYKWNELICRVPLCLLPLLSSFWGLPPFWATWCSHLRGGKAERSAHVLQAGNPRTYFRSSVSSNHCTAVIFKRCFIYNAMPVLTVPKTNFKDSIWTSVIKGSSELLSNRVLSPSNNMLLIGTQLVIYTIWLWSAVRAALSTLGWNYPAITNVQLKLGATQESLIYPALSISSANIHPLRPLVAHLENCK